jgi:hypothetical protein
MSGQSDANAEQNLTGKALVLVSSRDEQRVLATVAIDAGFLAQLIACRAGVAGYRRNRREEPGIASDCYKASAGKLEVKSRTVKVA